MSFEKGLPPNEIATLLKTLAKNEFGSGELSENEERSINVGNNSSLDTYTNEMLHAIKMQFMLLQIEYKVDNMYT